MRLEPYCCIKRHIAEVLRSSSFPPNAERSWFTIDFWVRRDCVSIVLHTITCMGWVTAWDERDLYLHTLSTIRTWAAFQTHQRLPKTSLCFRHQYGSRKCWVRQRLPLWCNAPLRSVALWLGCGNATSDCDQVRPVKCSTLIPLLHWHVCHTRKTAVCTICNSAIVTGALVWDT